MNYISANLLEENKINPCKSVKICGQLLNLELGTLNLEPAAPLPYLWAAFKP